MQYVCLSETFAPLPGIIAVSVTSRTCVKYVHICRLARFYSRTYVFFSLRSFALQGGVYVCIVKLDEFIARCGKGKNIHLFEELETVIELLWHASTTNFDSLVSSSTD